MWHDAHDTCPFEVRRTSKNSRCPSCAAAGLSAYRFDGSAGTGPRLASDNERSVSRSAADHRAALGAAVRADAAEIAVLARMLGSTLTTMANIRVYRTRARVE